MSTPLDHQRAVAVSRKLQLRKFADPKVELDKYRSVVLGAGLALRQSGLLQLATFWAAKKGAPRDVLEDLVSILAELPPARAICQRRDDAGPLPGKDACETVASLIQRSAAEVALLSAEAEAVLGWMKRLVEGYHQQRERNKDKENGRNATETATRGQGDDARAGA